LLQILITINLKVRSLARYPGAGKQFALVCFVFTLMGCDEFSRPDLKQGEKPNILCIAIDDMNDWVGYLGGHSQTHTPNIDRLASEGFSFTRAYAAAPVCNPSRISVLSGMHPSTSGIYNNAQVFRNHFPDVVTLPEYFRQQGYFVLGSGKIFHEAELVNIDWDEHAPEDRQRFRDPQPQYLNLSTIQGGLFDWGAIPVEDGEMSDTKTVEWAIEKLNQDFERPFFMAVGLYRPHLPWYIPGKYYDAVPEREEIQLPKVLEDDLKDIPEAGRAMRRRPMHKRVVEAGQWEEGVRSYLASIHYTDHNVGRLMDALENSGYLDNTVVILWSDHGFTLGEKQHWRKWTLWERDLHVPMVITLPKMLMEKDFTGLPNKGLIDKPVSLMDLHPTIVELAGLEPRENIEAASLVPLLVNNNAHWDRKVLSTYEKNNHSVRSERWHYIRYADGSEELYDHEQDPDEFYNLAGNPSYQSIIDEHKLWLPEFNAEGVEHIGQ
jgi:arylsulfatase A-like enzyme